MINHENQHVSKSEALQRAVGGMGKFALEAGRALQRENPPEFSHRHTLKEPDTDVFGEHHEQIELVNGWARILETIDNGTKHNESHTLRFSAVTKDNVEIRYGFGRMPDAQSQIEGAQEFLVVVSNPAREPKTTYHPLSREDLENMTVHVGEEIVLNRATIQQNPNTPEITATVQKIIVLE